MSILYWILGGIGIGIVVGSILGRFAIAAGILLILLGVGPMTALFIYSEFVQPTGDMSSAGLLSTLILIMVTPFGVTVFFTGLLRQD